VESEEDRSLLITLSPDEASHRQAIWDALTSAQDINLLAIPTITIEGCTANDANGVFRQKIDDFIAAELNTGYYEGEGLKTFKDAGAIFGDSEEDLEHFFQLGRLFAFIIFYHQQHS